MRFRLMATYRGVPYEAGAGPSPADVVLFAACPPPEELGFEPAPGHWRKRVTRAEVDALWESRPVGIFRGEPCIVLDDLGDRLHITYRGTDPERAASLGYWQVDRGVFEVLAPREEVTGLSEERVDRPLRWAGKASREGGAAARPGGTGSWPAQSSPAGGTQPVPAPALAPLAVPPSGPEIPGNGTAPGQPSARHANGTHSGLLAAPSPAPALTVPPAPASPQPAFPARQPGPTPGQAGAPDAAQAFPPAGTASPAETPAPAGPAQAPPPPQAMARAAAAEDPPVPADALAPPPAGAPAPAQAAAPGERRGGRGRSGRRQRVTARTVFCELADRAAIPRHAYALETEADGAMCLMPSGTGYEVFLAADGARHEVRSFADEETAYFYLFGVLAAEAIRNGGLGPVSRDETARSW
jgi:hypothetical protein